MPIAARSHVLRALALAATPAVTLVCGTGAARAHPHVWVTAKAQLVYEAGRVAGVRHAWSFDPEYTSFVTQGLDANGDGRLTPDELAELAAENTKNLAAFGYFTKLKVAGREQAFAEPAAPAMRLDEAGPGGKTLTLSFLLPLKAPAQPGRGVAALEVYDPTFFVSFAFAEGADAATLEGAPPGCAATVTRPKPAPEGEGSAAAKPGMSEAFFEALTTASAYGAQFTSRILVACP